jgi:hypothetical protein
MAKGNKTVTVACRLPNGLDLRLFRMEEWDEPVMGGGFRKTKRAVQYGEVVTLKGTAVPFGSAPTASPHGYALTHGVPADVWEQWLEQNKQSPIVLNHQVFAQPTPARANDMAKEHKSARSGLEPITPDTDKRIPRGIKTDKDRTGTGEGAEAA